MSSKKYTTTSNNRLTELARMTLEDFEALLSRCPEWVQERLINSLSSLTHA